MSGIKELLEKTLIRRFVHQHVKGRQKDSEITSQG